MAQIDNVLELMKTLIRSIAYSTITISKASLSDIQTYLQKAQDKIDFLHLESQLQQEDLQKYSHDSELVFVQDNHFVETHSHQQLEIDQIIDPLLGAVVDVDAGIQSALPKSVIRSWEYLVHKKHRICFRYDKEVSFHIPYYSKPI